MPFSILVVNEKASVFDSNTFLFLCSISHLKNLCGHNLKISGSICLHVFCVVRAKAITIWVCD